jgi:hypothetical protein
MRAYAAWFRSVGQNVGRMCARTLCLRMDPRQRKLRGSNPVQCCFLIGGRSGGRPVTCDPYSPTVTARARRGPAVLGAVRTQRGPVSLRNGGRPIRRHGAAVSALAIQLALIVPLKAPAVQVELAANPVSLSRRLGMACSLGGASCRPDSALRPRSCHPDNHAEGAKYSELLPRRQGSRR